MRAIQIMAHQCGMPTLETLLNMLTVIAVSADAFEIYTSHNFETAVAVALL